MPRKSTLPTDDAPVATMPARSPADIAAAVAEVETNKRRQALAQDVRRWRELVVGIADGHEPSGAELAELADLAARLKLPAGAVAEHVNAIARDRQADADVAGATQRLAATKARQEQHRRELAETRERLRQLEQEVANYQADAMSLPALMGARNENRANYSVLFAAPELVAERMIDAESGMSRARLAGMSPGRSGSASSSWES